MRIVREIEGFLGEIEGRPPILKRPFESLS
jgi:hypothetical protein